MGQPRRNCGFPSVPRYGTVSLTGTSAGSMQSFLFLRQWLYSSWKPDPLCAYVHVGRVEPPTAVGAEGIVRGTGGEWP